MSSFRKHHNRTGLIIFIITAIVFFMSAERTGSLWDCGEFILGAYKLQVVHPPGAPLFILIGRMFTWAAEILSDNPADIAFAVNLMSGLCTAAAAALAGMTTMIFGKLSMSGRGGQTTADQNLALSLGGIVAGLTTAFATSIWFSAVEGEVYAMSTFFTAMTFWSAVYWYYLPNIRDNDRWLVFSLFSAGLSTGVHLLSLLALPAIALLYYYKRYEKTTFLGVVISLLSGVVAIGVVQKLIIAGIPGLWQWFDIALVNNLGLPQHFGLIPTVLVVAGIFYFLLKRSHNKKNYLLQLVTVSMLLITIAFSTIGTVVIRANADTPINMNVPSDATRLLPYLNREQYGERPLLVGPTYDASPTSVDKEPRYGYVDGKYISVDDKFTYEYASKDKILFPRIGHTEGNRPNLHNMWRDVLNGNHRGKPGMGYNIQFLMNYQLGWMYGRYFMWNFVGRQNAVQGYYPWDLKSGHWQSGVTPIDEARLFNQSELPDNMKNDRSRSFYFFLPLLFGILGLIYHYMNDKRDFFILLILFVITGIGISIYSNSPPSEPRERDYIFAGSFMAFSMWVGMGVYFLYDLFKTRLNLKGMAPAALAGLLVLSAPVIMGFENFPHHDRSEHLASRDYAHNFLHSVDENAIIFTYGDNDTYPLWYAQEVENIRRDVRVVNLSLIAVDWYINKLRSRVNDSPPINLTLSEDAYRGRKRNQVFFHNPNNPSDEDLKNPVPLDRALEFIGNEKNDIQGQTIINSKNLFIPIDQARLQQSGIFESMDTSIMTNRIDIQFSKGQRYITKDDLAILDIIGSNFYDRPIYFATTTINSKLLGMNDYMQLEGLALRLMPTKTPSDPSLAIYGSGTVAEDKVYDRVMNQWKWGNFDKEDTFVDENYLAAVQSMKMGILRAAFDFAQKNEMKKAADLANKYFEAFPHMNFPYDGGVVPFINVLVSAGDFENAKKHLRILAEESRQYMVFYESLSEDDLSSFEDDLRYRVGTINQVINLAGEVQNPVFKEEINTMLKDYRYQNTKN